MERRGRLEGVGWVLLITPAQCQPSSEALASAYPASKGWESRWNEAAQQSSTLGAALSPGDSVQRHSWLSQLGRQVLLAVL